MTRTRVAIAIAAALLLGGCAGTSQPAPTASSPVTTEPTITGSPSTSQDPDIASAENAIVDFWQVRDAVASNPSGGVTKLDTVARGQALDVHQRSLNAEFASGLRQVGSTVVTPISASPAATTGEFDVAACVDVSKVNVVDKDGKSHVPTNRPPRSRYDYVVQKTSAGWFVISDPLKAKPC